MLSLGVNIGHDRGAALVEDGRIVCAISLERLDRVKHSTGVELPYEAMQYCLDAGGFKYSDLDVIVYNYPHHNNAYPVLDKVKGELNQLCSRVVFVPHHLAHACSVFYSSNFDESVVMVCDGAGNRHDGDTAEFFQKCGWNINAASNEIEAETGYHFSNDSIKLIYKRWQTRNGANQKLSLGRMYWETCVHVGMGFLDGGKLMGLAPYGEKLIKPMNVIKTGGDDFHIDLNLIKSLPSGSFEDNAKTAWIIQNSLEETLVWLANTFYRYYPSPNVCVSGGIGLNSVSNERILRESPFENIFIAPASNDSGIPLGCAFFGYYHVLGGKTRHEYKPYTGRPYSDDEIALGLQQYSDQIKFIKSTNPSHDVAQIISDQKIVAWYQGGSEYGPRALGHRSILCDPRQAEMKDILNHRVKHRESYRPFAPSVLYEEAHRFFDLKSECPYMLQIVEVTEEGKRAVPAITHVDGTARLQTVRREQNPEYYDMIKAFGEITGVPVVLNTSFNVAGEPVVETPQDAIRCFLGTDIDVLVLGDYLVQKQQVNAFETDNGDSGRRKRILLTTSAAPGQAPFSTSEKRMPIGVGYLIAVLREAGHEVFFIDNYLEQSDFLETDYIQRNKIDYVGIYCNTICFRDTLRMVNKLEQMRHTGRWAGEIIVGGPHTTVAADTIPDFVDYVVQGEGERAIVDIVDGKVNERMVRYPQIEDLDSLPRPALDVFTKLPYDTSMEWFEEGPVYNMNTSRSCPFRCSFCSVGSIWGKKYTYFSAERVVSDIEYLIEHHGVKGIYFREDNFTLNKKRLMRFCELMIERNVKIPWACESRVSTLDEENVKLMKKAGVIGYYFGVESGSQRMLDMLKKDITVEQIKNAFALCHRYDIKTAASVIVGVPGETEEDIQLTNQLINEIKPTTTWPNVFVGIPNSELYQEVLKKRQYEYIDDRGLVYLQGHNQRVMQYYGVRYGRKFAFPMGQDCLDMSQKPLVSVLLSVYNAEKYIQQALQSIYSQSFQDFEIIIVDDASTDGTADILQQMRDSRTIIYRNNTNIGLTKSLNVGLKFCRGDYIARMDADDISMPERFEKQVSVLNSDPNCAAVGSCFQWIDECGTLLEVGKLPTTPEKIRERMLIYNAMVHGAVMVRKSVLLSVGGYDEKYTCSQDYDLWLRLSEIASLRNIDEILYCLRRRSDSISTSSSNEQALRAQEALIQACKRRNTPCITIVTVNINMLNSIKQFVSNVYKSSDVPFDLLVVDCGSTDGSQDYLKNEGRVRLVELGQNVDYGSALDLAVRYVNTKYMIVLHPLAVPTGKDWLSSLLGPLNPETLASGVCHNREYVHPACMAIETRTLLGLNTTFKPNLSSDGNIQKLGKTNWDVGEHISMQIMNSGKKLHYFACQKSAEPAGVC